MSTRSRIGIRNEDGSITSIYCHSDGYLSGVGAALIKHYNKEHTKRLMSFGDRSFLTDDASKEGSYSARGESNVNAITHDDIDWMSEEYNYLQDTSGQWLYRKESQKMWQKLTEERTKD